jgi:pilus assembly protein CpaF
VKLSTLPLLAGRNIDAGFVIPTVAATIDLVVHAELERGGRRRITQIVAPTGQVLQGRIEVDELFVLGADGALRSTGRIPDRMDKFRRAGVDPRAVLGAVT